MLFLESSLFCDAFSRGTTDSSGPWRHRYGRLDSIHAEITKGMCSNKETNTQWQKTLQGLFFLDGTCQCSLPEIVLQFTHLTRLSLLENDLLFLPAAFFSHFTQLKKLDLLFNHFTSLPESTSLLSELKNANLGFNRFQCIPKELVALTNLKSLDMRCVIKIITHQSHIDSQNPIQSFPSELSNLKQLTFLSLRY